ncbi:hypothetical protein MRX96_009313 [Rhipicephalus microplus]
MMQPRRQIPEARPPFSEPARKRGRVGKRRRAEAFEALSPETAAQVAAATAVLRRSSFARAYWNLGGGAERMRHSGIGPTVLRTLSCVATKAGIEGFGPCNEGDGGISVFHLFTFFLAETNCLIESLIASYNLDARAPSCVIVISDRDFSAPNVPE